MFNGKVIDMCSTYGIITMCAHDEYMEHVEDVSWHA